MIACVIGAASAARAQRAAAEGASDKPWFAGTTLEQRERARLVFLEGNRLIRVPAFAEAAQKYKEAIEIWDNPAFHYNLAIAQINLLQPTDAYESLHEALRHGAAPLGEDKHERALEYMRSLEAQLARVHITCDQPGVEVSLDGRLLFTAPGTYAGVVQPGAHQLVASREGYLTETRDLVGSPGEATRVVLRLRKPDQVLTVRHWAAWKPWLVAGAGVALLGGAAYLDFKTSGDFDRFDRRFAERCPMGCQNAQIPAEFTDRLSRARTQQTMALVTYAAGSAVLVTGAVLLYVNRERVIRVEDEDNVNVSLTPVVTGDGAGIRAGIEF